MSIEVSVVRVVTPELVRAMNIFLPQLSSSAKSLAASDLERIIESQASTLFVATDENAIVGTLTLIVFEIPSGSRAWIEDVIVDESVRGRGVGRALVSTAIDDARRRGVATIDLTSRPSREAANQLYQHLGFEKRTTNVYRYSLES